jgi:hypothetical protein
VFLSLKDIQNFIEKIIHTKVTFIPVLNNEQVLLEESLSKNLKREFSLNESEPCSTDTSELGWIYV